MLNHDELLTLQSSLNSGIRTGQLLLRKLPDGDERDLAANQLNGLRQALVLREKLLTESAGSA